MSRFCATSEIYAKLPPGVVRKTVYTRLGGIITKTTVTTAMLRRLLRSDLDPAIKNRLYAFLLHRRRS